MIYGPNMKEDNLSSKANHNCQSSTPNGQAKEKTMSPAANGLAHDVEIALQNDKLSIARSIIDQDREEKIAAFVLARRIEARKEEELELARAIRRRHEEEQIQKRLLSFHREREIMKRDPELLAISLSSGGIDSLRSDSTSRLANELSLLRGSNGAMGNEVSALSQLGNSRLMSLGGYDGMLRSTSSQLLGSTPLSSRTSAFADSQALLAERLQLRNNLQLNGTGLSHLYTSRPSIPISASSDIASLRNYYSNLPGSGNLGNAMHSSAAMAASMHGANFLTGAEAGLGSSLLRSPVTPETTSSGILGIASSQHRKRFLEGSGNLFLNGTKRLRTIEQTSGISASNPEDDQQQKRFNKHQCKQWTLKFQELLAFKERNGHCNVPHGYKDNLPLAMWVKRQRHQYNLMTEKKTSTLTGERIKLLENIGFVWNCLETAWEQHYKELCNFKMRTGHCSVPTTYRKNPRLASWVVTQRRQCKLLEDGKPSSMTKRRLEKLKLIDFPVHTKKTDSNSNLKK